MTARAATIRFIVAEPPANCESVPKPRSDLEMHAIARRWFWHLRKTVHSSRFFLVIPLALGLLLSVDNGARFTGPEARTRSKERTGADPHWADRLNRSFASQERADLNDERPPANQLDRSAGGAGAGGRRVRTGQPFRSCDHDREERREIIIDNEWCHRRGGDLGRSRATARAGSTRPDSTQKLTRAQASVSQTPRSSSWEQEPLRPAARPQASAPSRPHTYYPGLRPGRSAQKPVRLTTRPTRIPPTFGTPGGNHVPAGAGHHR